MRNLNHEILSKSAIYTCYERRNPTLVLETLENVFGYTFGVKIQAIMTAAKVRVVKAVLGQLLNNSTP